MPSNLLFFGDNLRILRDHVADGTVDLVYLDPPFNSNRSYNIIFKEHDEHPSEAQIRAFEDTWHWDTASADLYESKGFGKSYPKLQILTIEGLLNGTERLQAPLGNVTFKQAPRSKRETRQRGLADL
jgi:hypothetical protein